MSLQEFEQDFQDLKAWLSQITLPVFILAWSGWRRAIECEEMRKIVEALSKESKYEKSVRFFWFDPDNNGQTLKSLSIIDTPCVVIFKDGKEIVRFSSTSSKSAMVHHLDNLLDPARSHQKSYVLRGLPR